MIAAQTLTFTLAGADSDTALPPALRRACDRCRRRKTRCDGLRECANCFKASVACSYLASPKRKGPKKRRGRAESTSHETRSDANEASHAVKHGPDEPQEDTQNASAGECLLFDADESTEQPQTCALEAPSVTTGPGYLSNQNQLDATPASEWSQFSFDALESVSTVESIDRIPLERRYSSDIPTIPTGQFANSTFLDTALEFSRLPYETSLIPNGEHASTIPCWVFIPYVRLFFERLYPIFPVLDKKEIFAAIASYETQQWHITDKQYAFLTALCATVIVQLNICDQSTLTEALSSCSDLHGLASLQATDATYFHADAFVTQCLEARKRWDFMETPDDYTIMTSFFLFCFYGNRDQAQRAWYYLRESIGFALSLGMDEPESYDHLERHASQRRRRLFWLLFVTERAYALQHRSGVMLRPSIDLATIFESEEPKLIYGFVNLVSLFRAIDETFVLAWKGQRTNDIGPSTSYNALDISPRGPGVDEIGGGAGAVGVLEIDETQRLDIMVSKQWLHVLAWKLRHNPGGPSTPLPLQNSGERGGWTSKVLMYPFKVSKELLGIISSANRKSLESHGIGMEQKIFDVACCLNDVLSASTDLGRGTFSFGHNMLHSFMTTLASFRNHESQYLQPLLVKAANTLATGMQIPRQMLDADDIGDDFLQQEDCDQMWEIRRLLR